MGHDMIGGGRQRRGRACNGESKGTVEECSDLQESNGEPREQTGRWDDGEGVTLGDVVG